MKKSTDAGSVQTDYLIRVDQVMQLYARYPFAAIISLMLSTALFFTQRPVIGFPVLMTWWSAVMVITVVRLLLVKRFRNAESPETHIETWAARFLTGTFFSGLAWGAAGVFLFPGEGMLNQLILIFTLAGLGSAAITTLGVDWDNISAFLCCMLVPPILRFIFIGGVIYQVMALMTLIYLLALLTISHSTHSTVKEVLRLRSADIEQEAMLLESREKYRNVVERSNDGIGIICDGKIKYANEQLTAMSGYRVEELTGKPFFAFIHPDEVENVTSRYKRRMAGEAEAAIYETAALHKSGRKVHMELNVGMIPYHGKPAELVIVRDITERRQVEAALRESEDRYRALFNHASDFIFIVDPLVADDPVIADVNEYACKKYGYDREELIGKPYAMVNDEASQEKLTDKTVRILSGEILNFESVHMHKDGHRFPVEVSARLITIREKPVMIAIVRDITGRKQAEERIKAALREKEVLLKEIHHRVKNNLQVISSLLSLQSKYTNDKQVVEVFKKSQERIRAMAIAHEKLYHSNDLSQVDFKDYINSLVAYLFETSSFSRGQVRLERDIETISVSLETAIPLGLIINELISNCLKHAFPGGRSGIIRVELRNSDEPGYDYVLIISDNGVVLPGGIDFEKGGSLGMILVGTLVKQLHGAIDYETEVGTRFTIKFNKKKG